MQLKLTDILYTPAQEELTVSEMIDLLYDEIRNNPEDSFCLSIGTDSMTYKDTFFVLAVVLYRIGKGGTFFYKRMKHNAVKILRDKLYDETEISIEAINLIREQLLKRNENICDRVKLSVHLDS